MSHSIAIGQRDIKLDAEGFLRTLSDWDKDVAIAIACAEGLVLNEAHWEVLNLLRTHYKVHKVTLANRALVNLVKRELGADKGKSIYLMKLFTGSPAKISNKIAGLPKPDNCI
ncbi:MAG: tRNA 2-thiouridine synthesizing protein E [Pseudohongiellaceae bacterium]|jgi:tRNA 2-thiouridine synthesizing protein E